MHASLLSGFISEINDCLKNANLSSLRTVYKCISKSFIYDQKTGDLIIKDHIFQRYNMYG